MALRDNETQRKTNIVLWYNIYTYEAKKYIDLDVNIVLFPSVKLMLNMIT